VRRRLEKTPPFLIFWGKNDRAGHIKRDHLRKEGYPEEMEYGIQEGSWMDEALMLEWSQKIWQPMTQRSNKITYLILDECRWHLTAAVRKAFVDCNTEMDLIPARYSSKLRPMDVGLNKPFKGCVSDNFTDWLIAKRKRKPIKQDVAAWIHTGWNRLSEQIVLNAYRGSGYIKESVVGGFLPIVDRLLIFCV
jgi:DDE superfamily endonuclease